MPLELGCGCRAGVVVRRCWGSLHSSEVVSRSVRCKSREAQPWRRRMSYTTIVTDTLVVVLWWCCSSNLCTDSKLSLCC